MERSKAPVFVVGSPRSGTTFLYHSLLSAGNFAIYQTESDIFNQTGLAFGDLGSLANRTRLLQAWLGSDYFQRTGLDTEEVRGKMLTECKNAGDFLRIVMDLMARHQGVERWADNTPTHLLYMARIKSTIPDALFVHIIRDGRDVAISMNQLNWGGYRCPWDQNYGLEVSGLYWEWLLRRGREDGRQLGPDYLEIRYENLVRDARGTLKQLGAFIEHDLDVDRIQRRAVGTVRVPNSSFDDASSTGTFNPIGRRRDLAGPSAVRLEALLAPLLRELGYPTNYSTTPDFTGRRLRAFYARYRALRHSLKQGPLAKYLICKNRLRSGALNNELRRWGGFSMDVARQPDPSRYLSRSNCLSFPENRYVQPWER